MEASSLTPVRPGAELRAGGLPRVGILGGAGAIASARFHLALMERWAVAHEARTDADFPLVIHSSRDLGLTAAGLIDVDRTRDLVLQALEPLAECDVVAVVCNSIAPALPDDPRLLTPVLACAEALREVPSAWLLASESTVTARLYQEAFPHVKWKMPRISMTPWIRAAIHHGGVINISALGVPPGDTVVLGCTELAAAANRPGVISSHDELLKLLCTIIPKPVPSVCSRNS